jgi:hypothetical protein
MRLQTISNVAKEMQRNMNKDGTCEMTSYRLMESYIALKAVHYGVSSQLSAASITYLFHLKSQWISRGNEFHTNHDSSVSIALGYGLDNRGYRVRFPAEAGNFSFHHCVQNGSGAHSDSYTMGITGCFPRGKAAGA